MNPDIHKVVVQLMIAYTLAGAFIFTVIVTCLSLIGRAKIVHRSQQKKLFYAVVLEIIVIGVASFKGFINFSPEKVEKTAVAEANAEQSLATLVSNAASGTNNINLRDVESVSKAGKLSEAMSIFKGPGAAEVKRRQFAQHLVALNRLQDAYGICQTMTNKSEIRNVAKAVVDKVKPGASGESEEWQFLCGTYGLLASPQRNELFEHMNRRAITLRCQWQNHKSEG